MLRSFLTVYVRHSHYARQLSKCDPVGRVTGFSQPHRRRTAPHGTSSDSGPPGPGTEPGVLPKASRPDPSPVRVGVADISVCGRCAHKATCSVHSMVVPPD